jgi:hypothetical protein
MSYTGNPFQTISTDYIDSIIIGEQFNPDDWEYTFLQGKNNNVGTANLTLESTAYTTETQNTAVQLELYSTTANDTIAGTGARKVTITGLDSAWVTQTETIELSGTSVVTTTGNFLRVNNLIVTAAGTTKKNQGDIICKYSGTTAIVSFIVENECVSYIGRYSVAAGKLCYLIAVLLTSGKGKGISLSVRIINNAQADGTDILGGFINSYEQTTWATRLLPRVTPPKADVVLQAYSVDPPPGVQCAIALEYICKDL